MVQESLGLLTLNLRIICYRISSQKCCGVESLTILTLCCHLLVNYNSCTISLWYVLHGTAVLPEHSISRMSNFLNKKMQIFYQFYFCLHHFGNPELQTLQHPDLHDTKARLSIISRYLRLRALSVWMLTHTCPAGSSAHQCFADFAGR